MRTIRSKDEWRSLVGQELGVSEWLEITQERVNAFAGATGDHQWIHVDPARAKGGPFGGTIAHGYLTLSLGPLLLESVVAPEGFRMAINYGLDKLRYPSPVRVGSRVRLRAHVLSAEDVENGAGVQAKVKLTFEVEGQEKPGCVAEALFRYYA